MVRGLDHGPDQGPDPGDRTDGTAQVEAAGVTVARLRQQPPSGDQSGLRYRLFALEHREQYGVMFGGALASGEPSAELAACSDGAFQELVSHVSTGMAAGLLLSGDPQEVAQQIWSAVHGAVTLEMAGRTFADDPEVTYRALMELLIRGLSVPSAEPQR